MDSRLLSAGAEGAVREFPADATGVGSGCGRLPCRMMCGAWGDRPGGGYPRRFRPLPASPAELYVL